MAVTSAKLVEVEIQEQLLPDPKCKYMLVLRYQPENKESNELLNIVLTNEKPLVRHTIDDGSCVRDMVLPSLTKPKKITNAKELFGGDRLDTPVVRLERDIPTFHELAKANPNKSYKELEKENWKQ